MIFVRNKIDISFKTKNNPNIECGIGVQFYVLVYGDITALLNNTVHKICFPVPVHFPSFILTIKGDLTCNFEELFIFKKIEDKNKLILFLKKNLKTEDFKNAKLLPEFYIKKTK